MAIRLLVVDSESSANTFDVAALAAEGVLADVTEFASPDCDRPQPDVIWFADRAERGAVARVAEIKAIAPECRALLVAGACGSRALAYLQAGVVGVADFGTDTQRLAEIAHRVLGGAYYLDPDIAQVLAIRHVKRLLEPFNTLSSREFDVFCMLAEGFALQDIAEQLGISSKTVSNCQTSLKLKLGLDGRDAMKKFAQSHGLISG
ncbi:LuxR C-terminal-related transcriptional regulator [Methylomonas sp. HW2-6]|uniref:LuxR C-terminal-related transcriptional regulator n=1 Tax=Methylomonas sp. HW2-6 TaxID=3376687 RepID=UPI0040429A22